MHDPHGQLMPWMIRLAEALPVGTLQTLASAIATCSAQEWGRVRLQATQAVPQPQLRALVVDLLTVWQEQAPHVLPVDVALMLRTAAATARSVRASQSVELVRTGPLVAGPAMRRTDQALLQVINAAQ